MIFIERPTIRANVIYVSVVLQLLLAAIVIAGAERLQFSKPEHFVIALMRDDVICGGRSNNMASLQTHGA